MIVHETAINQMTVEIKVQQIPLQSSITNRSHGTITEAVKGPKNVKLFIKHENRPNL